MTDILINYNGKTLFSLYLIIFIIITFINA